MNSRVQQNLFGDADLIEDALEIHEHRFISGPRSGSSDAEFSHAHQGGGVPHCHPHTGPSFYGYRKPRTVRKPTGEQFDETIPLTEEELSFDLVITDSALIHGKTPIGDTPVEALGFPAAERLMSGHRLRCNVRDERNGGTR